ncbi:MAG: pirin family protein [Sulfuriferula sp.]
MIQLNKGSERGYANHGWLESWHSFSFADYYDPDKMGVASLRVINDDKINAKGGFPTHPHRDMEIITYVLSGTLAHRDSMGNGSIIQAGDVQKMSAGTGIRHSEFNPSQDTPVHLLQIWIRPRQLGISSSYEQKNYSRADKKGRLCLIASPSLADNVILLQQDVNLYAAILAAEDAIIHTLPAHRIAYLHVAMGEVTANQMVLAAGDAIVLTDETLLTLSTPNQAEVLLFDINPNVN